MISTTAVVLLLSATVAIASPPMPGRGGGRHMIDHEEEARYWREHGRGGRGRYGITPPSYTTRRYDHTTRGRQLIDHNGMTEEEARWFREHDRRGQTTSGPRYTTRGYDHTTQGRDRHMIDYEEEARYWREHGRGGRGGYGVTPSITPPSYTTRGYVTPPRYDHTTNGMSAWEQHMKEEEEYWARHRTTRGRPTEPITMRPPTPGHGELPDYDDFKNQKCPVQSTPTVRGCYAAKRSFKRKRLLVYWRHDIEWGRDGERAEFGRALVCACQKAAREAGVKHFAIHFWGECWAVNTRNFRKAKNGGDCTRADFSGNDCPRNKACLAYKSFMIYGV